MDNYIQQELAIIERDTPGYLRRFQKIMRQGVIDGQYYGGGKAKCGCFYGHRADLNVGDAEQAQEQVFWELHAGDWKSSSFTPIEILINQVRPGDTPEGLSEGSQALRTLDREITSFYLSHSQQEEASHL